MELKIPSWVLTKSQHDLVNIQALESNVGSSPGLVVTSSKSLSVSEL